MRYRVLAFIIVAAGVAGGCASAVPGATASGSPHSAGVTACLHGSLTVRRTVNGRKTTTIVCRRSIYLALGDSLAYGFQPNGDLRHGYVDDLFRALKPRGIRTVVNMGCGGETSTTFINGGCPFALILRVSYQGPQLQAALQFIRTHRGQIGVVTIDIGGNDFLNNFDKVTCAPQANYPAVVTTFDANFKATLTQLRGALRGTAPLLSMNYYDVYANQCAGHPGALADFVSSNARIAADAGLNRVPVANVFKAFGGATAPNPRMCQDTWICSSYHDIHPTANGYKLIARTFARITTL